jgi:hypothetical protein
MSIFKRNHLLGTAIYVFCVFTQQSDLKSGVSYMTFDLDGVSDEEYTRLVPGYSHNVYKGMVYSKTGLAQAVHTLSLHTKLGEGAHLLASLDHIIYTLVFPRT